MSTEQSNQTQDETTLDLSGYSITFSFNRFLGCWSWSGVAPDGALLIPPLGLFKAKEAAERDALRAIDAHGRREMVDGETLRRRLA